MILCHSMGGLIASYFLCDKKDNLNVSNHSLTKLINKIYLIATPFQGAMKFLLDLTNGTKIGFNNTLLSSYSLGTFPSLYYLLPLQKNINVKDYGQNQECQLSDFKTWEKFKLGIFNLEARSCQIYERRKKYLTDCLSSANDLNTLLNTKDKERFSTNLNIVTIRSNHRKTISNLEICKNSNTFNWQYEKGDGTVPFYSTQLPQIFSECKVSDYVVKAKHSQMLSNKTVQKILWHELGLSIMN